MLKFPGNLLHKKPDTAEIFLGLIGYDSADESTPNGHKPCENPRLGKLIGVAGFNYIADVLGQQTEKDLAYALGLEEGAKTNTRLADRQALLAELTAHFNGCAHCKIVSSAILEADERFDQLGDLMRQGAGNDVVEPWFEAK